MDTLLCGLLLFKHMFARSNPVPFEVAVPFIPIEKSQFSPTLLLGTWLASCISVRMKNTDTNFLTQTLGHKGPCLAVDLHGEAAFSCHRVQI